MKNLHFVQSIEPLQGGGLGLGALGLHLSMRTDTGSQLVATKNPDYNESFPDVTLYNRKGPSALYYSPAMRNESKSLVDHADWVHGHGLYVGPNAFLGMEAIRQKKSLCYHVQGFFDPWILRRSRWKKWLVNTLFEKRNCQHVRLWRALTRKEEGQIRALGFKQPIVVLPNGIRLEEIDQTLPESISLPHPKQSRKYRALFLGRIHPKKGLDILIQSWSTVHKINPDWELLVVGPDEGGYQAEVEQMIATAGLKDSISLFPSVSGPEKVAIFRSADLFVLSSYSEGFPVAIVEAAAHGMPCVITTECNFPELAEAGAAWESPPTVEAYTSILGQALAAGEDELKQRGSIGRRLIESRYTWPQIAKQMIDACEKG